MLHRLASVTLLVSTLARATTYGFATDAQFFAHDSCPDYADYAQVPHPPFSSGPLGLPNQRPSEHCRCADGEDKQAGCINLDRSLTMVMLAFSVCTGFSLILLSFRTFSSRAVDALSQNYTSRMKDQDLAALFANALGSTLGPCFPRRLPLSFLSLPRADVCT